MNDKLSPTAPTWRSADRLVAPDRSALDALIVELEQTAEIAVWQCERLAAVVRETRREARP